MKRRAAVITLAAALTMGSLAGCGNQTAQKEKAAQAEPETQIETEAGTVKETVSETEVELAEEQTKTPKYIFLFIGDGMSYPQIQLTNYFVSASQGENGGSVTVDGEEKSILSSKNQLTMMSFPIAGSAQTYDSTSFAPDSASTATSIATGKKTWSGSINVS